MPRLFTPGPVEVPREVLERAAARLVSHRSGEFHELYRSVQRRLTRLYGLGEGFVALLSGSGTTAVDAMVWSLVRPGERVLAVVHGEFGERLAETARRRGALVDAIRPGRVGEPVTLEAVAEALEGGGYSVVAIVHNETSLGLAYRQLAELAALASKHGARMLVDAVSSLAGEEFSMEWGLAAAASASHKAIAAPPGVSFVAVRGTPTTADGVPLALDLSRYAAYHERSETPFTPPVTLLYALEAALERIERIGLARYIGMHRERARILYEELPRYGFQPVVVDERFRSNTVAAFYAPASSWCIREKLRGEGYVVAGGMGGYTDKIVRIGVMGDVDEEDVKSLVGALARAARLC